MIQMTYQARAAAATLQRSPRNSERQELLSRTTNCRLLRSRSSGRSTSASRTGWSLPRSSDLLTRRSKRGTRIEGELYLIDISKLSTLRGDTVPVFAIETDLQRLCLCYYMTTYVPRGTMISQILYVNNTSTATYMYYCR